MQTVKSEPAAAPLSPLKQAFLALEEARARVEELERERMEPIAVVGIGCRIPGGEDGVEGYWRLLHEQKCAVQDGVEARFAEALEQTNSGARLPEEARWAALLDHVDLFEPQHFGISPREAVGIDPQQRLFLEASWEALENAGIDPFSTYKSSTGVYLGISAHDYEQLQLRDADLRTINPHFASGIAASVASGRVSYVLGLNGPGLSVDTACSSSLVAVHLACSALRRGDCVMALAGGVNVILSPGSSVAFAQAGMLSPGGVCRAFDAAADGFVRGEGCGVVVLKRLRDAEANGDRIVGVILGSAVNQDGASSGLTVPNGHAQQDLLRRALTNAGVEAWQVGYVEAHGTGTSLGDPIEAEALGAVFGAGRKRQRPLLIGSVKTNVGHLESAAGIAGLIKVLLSLEHGVVPAQLHRTRPSEHVRWSELPLEVVTEARPWEAIAGRRIGGVSSFGFSGTNAHVILEGWTAEEQPPKQARPAEVLVITARTEPALRALAAQYADYLERSKADWGEICHTAATGRGVFAERLAVVAASKAEAAQQLRTWLSGEHEFVGMYRGHVRTGERVRVGLVLGRDEQELDSVIGIASGEEWSQAWRRKWRNWGLELVAVVPAGDDAVRELKMAGANLALASDEADLGLPAVKIKHGWRPLCEAVAELFVRGAEVNWNGWEDGRKLRRVALPTYPFQRERYWVAPQKRNREQIGESTGQTLLGRRLRTAGVRGQYESLLGLAETNWIAEHVVGGRAILPATGHLELMLEAAAEVLGAGAAAVEDVVLQAPLVVEKERAVQTVVERETEGRSRVRVYAEAEGNAWQAVSEGWIRAEKSSPVERIDVAGIRDRLKEQTDLKAFYSGMAARGVEFGEKFQGLRGLWIGEGEALGEVGVTAAEEGYAIAPWRLDACLQIAGAIMADSGEKGEMYLPLSVGEFTQYGQPGEACWSHVRTRRIDSDSLAADVAVCSPDGKLLARLNNLRFRKFTANTADVTSWMYRLKWQPDDLAPVVRESAVAGAGQAKRVLLLGTSHQGDGTAAHLRQRGAAVICASATRAGELLRTSAGQHAVVYFASSSSSTGNLSLGDVTGEAGRSLRGLLAVAQEIVRLPAAGKPRLYVITENAYAAGDDGKQLRLLETPLAGLANAIALEAPELRCTLIDGDAVAPGDLSAQIGDEVLTGSEELRVAIRSGRRYVARLERMPAPDLAGSASQPVRLVLGSQGRFSDGNNGAGVPGIEALTYKPFKRRELQPDEVEVAVRATALNFRDVLKATGVLDPTGAIGTDCSGVIVRRGSAVRDLEVGQAVVAIAPECFATHAVTAKELVAAKPAQLSFEEAAAQTIAYLTAEYCLHELAHIGKGQRVLIHAAAGGVGLAAVYLARKAGAEIIATAGSEQKRAYLRSLGIEQVLDSRTLAFQDHITGGVDIVLNSLAGAAIDAGLRLLRPGGIFVELGKTDIRGAGSIERKWPDARYLVADLTPLFAERSPWVKECLSKLLREIASGELPLLPVTTFAAREAKHAFRFMAAARHIGRVVVRTGARDLAGGVHLITGGLRGLGLRLAEWLVERGARDLILIGRRPPSQAGLESIAQLAAKGAAVRVLEGDIADLATAERVVREAGSRLRGIWHCAAVLDNAPLDEQSWERIAPVMRPKLDGAWNLHTLTHQSKLEFFVLFSSWASLAGARVQANYAAANAFLDGLANLRVAHGLPALSVNWGGWKETGAAAAESFQRQLARAGMDSMKSADALAALELALNAGVPQIAIATIQWPKYLSYTSGLSAFNAKDNPFYAGFVGHAAPGGPSGDGSDGGGSQHLSSPRPGATLAKIHALPAVARNAEILRVAEDLARKTLDLGVREEIDPDEPLSALGMDSLLAIELRNSLSALFVASLSSTLLFDYPTLRALARFIDQEIFSPAPEQLAVTKAAAKAVAADGRRLTLLDEIEQLSDDEVDALFGQALSSPIHKGD